MQTAEGKGISMAAILGLVLLMSFNSVLTSHQNSDQPTATYPEGSLPYSQVGKTDSAHSF